MEKILVSNKFLICSPKRTNSDFNFNNIAKDGEFDEWQVQQEYRIHRLYLMKEGQVRAKLEYNFDRGEFSGIDYLGGTTIIKPHGDHSVRIAKMITNLPKDKRYTLSSKTYLSQKVEEVVETVIKKTTDIAIISDKYEGDYDSYNYRDGLIDELFDANYEKVINLNCEFDSFFITYLTRLSDWAGDDVCVQAYSELDNNNSKQVFATKGPLKGYLLTRKVWNILDKEKDLEEAILEVTRYAPTVGRQNGGKISDTRLKKFELIEMES